MQIRPAPTAGVFEFNDTRFGSHNARYVQKQNRIDSVPGSGYYPALADKLAQLRRPAVPLRSAGLLLGAYS